MKIAYCFAGHFRTGKQNKTLIENLIGPNPGDVFVHTYPIKDVPSSQPIWHKDRAGADEPLSKDDIKWIRDTYNPLILEIDAQNSGASSMPPGWEKFGYRHSTMQVALSRRLYDHIHREKYDVVFNARFDLMMNQRFEFPIVNKDIVYAGLNLNMQRRGLDGDVFYFGTPATIDAMVLPAAPETEKQKMSESGFLFEAVFTAIRHRNGFGYVPIKYPYDLLRASGPLGVLNGCA